MHMSTLLVFSMLLCSNNNSQFGFCVQHAVLLGYKLRRTMRLAAVP